MGNNHPNKVLKCFILQFYVTFDYVGTQSTLAINFCLNYIYPKSLILFLTFPSHSQTTELLYTCCWLLL